MTCRFYHEFCSVVDEDPWRIHHQYYSFKSETGGGQDQMPGKVEVHTEAMPCLHASGTGQDWDKSIVSDKKSQSSGQRWCNQENGV